MSLNEHPEKPKMMMNELKTLNECKHPNIMRIFSMMEDDEFYYIASEFLDGELFDTLISLEKHYRPLVAAQVL